MLISLAFFALSCGGGESEENGEEAKTVCNDTGDCKDRASYCDIDSPQIDAALGTTVYYCKKRQVCKTQAECSMGWRCKESEGFCITNEEADIILCTTDKDCTNPAFPKCNLQTRECTSPDGSSSDQSGDLPDQNNDGTDTDTGTDDDDSGDSDTETNDDDSDTDTGTGTDIPLGKTLMLENFEDGGTKWTIEPATEGAPCWEIGIPTTGPAAAYEGEKVAATVLDGNYADNCNDLIYYNLPMTIPPAGVPVISFYAAVDIVGNGQSPYDYVEVLIKKENDLWETTTGLYLSSDTESQLAFLDNTRTKITKQQGENYKYYKFTGDLSAYKKESIKVGFRFVSNESESATGFYLDNVEISY